MDQEQDWTLPSGSLPSMNEVEDYPPELVDESSDEEWRENAEICSECSSADTDYNFQFLLQHYKGDRISERESSEDEVQPTKLERANDWCLPDLQCATCTLPRWTRGMDPRKHHCRNFCMHGGVHSNPDFHQDAPVLKESASVRPVSPLLCSPLLPPELAEIAQSAVRPLSRKKLKQQARRAEQLQSGETLLSAMSSVVESSTHIPAPPVHREKHAGAGDQMTPLIAWYSLVAKPIHRKMWASMPKAQAAVDAESEMLTAAEAPGTSQQCAIIGMHSARRRRS